MSEASIVTCPACGQRNRVPLGAEALCGRCKSPLTEIVVSPGDAQALRPSAEPRGARPFAQVFGVVLLGVALVGGAILTLGAVAILGQGRKLGTLETGVRRPSYPFRCLRVVIDGGRTLLLATEVTVLSEQRLRIVKRNGSVLETSGPYSLGEGSCSCPSFTEGCS